MICRSFSCSCAGDVGQLACVEPGAHRPGTLSRQHVRGHRGSTQLAEKRLPFDTVFIVNRFLGAVSQAVLECAAGRTSSSATACWRCSG